jgi:hypothetical protein
MTACVFAGIAILFAINLDSILTGSPINQTYIKHNSVRGMAVGRNQMLYTLNFEQQNKVTNILNRSVRVVGVKPGKRQKPDIDQIVIYQFDKKPDIILSPIAYVDDNLVFTAPACVDQGYLMELSNGDLQKLLAESYDS